MRNYDYVTPESAHAELPELDLKIEELESALSSRDAEIEGLKIQLEAIRVGRQRDAEAFDALRAKLAEAHRHCCTPENCVLDGGPEHAAAFPTKGGTDAT